MPAFEINSAGTVRDVRAPSIEAVKRVDLDFCDLDSFTQGYVEAMFFTSTGTDDDGDLQEAGFADLAPETLATIVADCAAFNAKFQPLADRAAETMADAGESYHWEDDAAGRDFWFTRNGHGAGFWDGDWPEPLASEATALSGEFRTVDLYRGDDGRLYLA